MKVLIVSNMYPSVELPYSGVFVKAQYDHFQREYSDSTDVSIFFMRQIITSKFKSLWKYLWTYLKFVPQLFKSYDVVHVHYFGFLAPLAVIYGFFHPNSKLFVTFHGSDINKDLPAIGFKNRLFRSLILNFNGTIAVGEALHEPLHDKLGIAPHTTLCAGIDKDIFYKEENPTKKYDFLVVGSFLEVKGIDVILEALEHVRREELSFCFIGNGPLESEILKIGEKASVDIKNNLTQDELRSFYNMSKYLLFSSKNDAFGLVVTESLFSGTPVLVSSSGGAQSQVLEGINGFVYENNSPKDLAKLMDSVLQINADDYDSLSMRAAASNFQHSLKNVCQKLIEAYSDSKFIYRSLLETTNI